MIYDIIAFVKYVYARVNVVGNNISWARSERSGKEKMIKAK